MCLEPFILAFLFQEAALYFSFASGSFTVADGRILVTSFSSRIVEIQMQMAARAIELLALPDESPSYILDIGYVSLLIYCATLILMTLL